MDYQSRKKQEKNFSPQKKCSANYQSTCETKKLEDENETYHKAKGKNGFVIDGVLIPTGNALKRKLKTKSIQY